MPDEPKKTGAMDPNIEKLTKTVGGLVTLTQNLARQNQDMGSKFNTIMEKMEKGEFGGKSPEAKKVSTEADDDDMNISTEDGDLDVKKLSKLIQKTVNDAVTPLKEELTNTKKSSVQSRLQQEFNELKEKHKDFEEWAPELKNLAKENPGLNLKRLYTLARAENPDKAKELDEKFAEPDPDVKKKEEQSKLFGGLRPSSTAMNSGKGEDDDGGEPKMTFQSASDKAWEETMAELPDALFGTEEG